MTQERYREYREDLKKQGFPVIETTSCFPTEETSKVLEEIFGLMPWNLITMGKVDGR